MAIVGGKAGNCVVTSTGLPNTCVGKCLKYTAREGRERERERERERCYNFLFCKTQPPFNSALTLDITVMTTY